MPIFTNNYPQQGVVAAGATVAVFSVSGTAPSAMGSTVLPSTYSSSHDFIITNSGPATIYLGQVGVTTSTGLPLPSGYTLTIQGNTEAVYGVAAASPTGGALVTSGLASLVVSE